MPQDRESGAAGDRFGREFAPKIATGIGARMLGTDSNTCEWNNVRFTLHCAGKNTKSVGVTHQTLPTVEGVLGAFQRKDGQFDVYLMSRADFQSNMTPTRSRGRSSGKTSQVARGKFKRLGCLVARGVL